MLAKMASLLPLIQDILPMIMPSSISVAKAADIVPPTSSPASQNEQQQNGEAPGAGAGGVRVLSRNAVVGKTDKMCASVLVVKPKSASAIHHNGEQDAIVYAVSGKGALLSSPKDEGEDPVRFEIDQGDFAFIPAWTEHQAVNESEEEDMRWVVIRSGSHPVEVSLTDWAGPQAKADSPKQ
ncbi:RmlC-like cupin domain-containing protein [Diplogelasinospora grovesii]|uniref:RmlC-like cupin domain-containing protein n=1 Tax=Diplogelasinospora grovesii TaxID=303347 RepID=A0AAN6N6A8_9PEZI|nr:RmlC-like cupin domain-containing protein [Diplogelasinospora grovesii]